MKIEHPRKGRLQQGMIFSCCAVSGYAGKQGWGVVITARCDLASSKMSVLNYLPVVRLEDWLERDGLAVIHSRCEAEVSAEIGKLLKDLGAPETVLLATPVDIALRTLVAALEEKKRKTFESRVAKVLQRYAVVSIETGDVLKLRAQFPGIFAAVIRELMTHRLSGYYYIPRVEMDESDGCYVILLRQIGAMPSALAAELPEGVRRIEAVSNYPGFEEYLHFATVNSVAMPLGVISSPHIEHLMQAFSMLFGRIGLPDTDKKHIERFASLEGV